MSLIPTTLTVVGAAVIRSVGGWAENALADGKVTSFEWKQLYATIFRVGLIGLSVAYGLGLEPIAAGGAAIFADFAFKAIAKIKKK